MKYGTTFLMILAFSSTLMVEAVTFENMSFTQKMDT